MVEFREIHDANRHWVTAIHPGKEARFWVHFNEYWLERASSRVGIQTRLVSAGSDIVGFIAFGQFYEDDALTRARSGWYELIHLVIDQRFQGRGFGRSATVKALQLIELEPDCGVLAVAHHPDNHRARSLYRSLGFHETDLRNYDNDPILLRAPRAAPDG